MSVTADKTRTSTRRRRWWGEVGWRYLVAIPLGFFAVVPLLYVLSASLNPRGTLAGSSALFSAFDLSNYAALGGTAFWTWFGNTLVIGLSASVGAVAGSESANSACSMPPCQTSTRASPTCAAAKCGPSIFSSASVVPVAATA